jgi:hypothetical protein
MKYGLLREVARHFYACRAHHKRGIAATEVRWDDSFASVVLAQQQNIGALLGAMQVRLRVIVWWLLRACARALGRATVECFDSSFTCSR